MWLEGYRAFILWRKQNEITGLYAVPYDTETEVGVTKDLPLGRWVHQQRKALRTGELEERRKTLLDAPEAGMVWEPGEEAWQSKLATLRSYRRATGHLAPRQDAVWGEGEAMVPIGQHLANLRSKGEKNGLGKDPERAAERAARLTAIDPDWDCPWPWTDSATTASSPTWSTPTATCPTSHPASSWTATTSAHGWHSRNSQPPGRNSPPSNRNG
ncbi:helicase associated domain-containing protein [Streptomyces sp. WM6378]|uniref:helicase associated domain-containing protein n=1 Tax=Streptomyces sp. WM6378 TaxID=1415557 RepID=UPI000AFCD30F